MSRLIVLITACLLGCSTAFAGPATKYQNEAKETAQTLMKRLGGIIKQKMKEEGPVGAIEACSVDALRIAGELSRETGWQVKRVGTRVRNPLIGMPDVWEQQVLAKFEKSHEAGVPFSDMAHGEMVKEPNGRYFRFLKPIAVKGPCLNCHGAKETIPTPVRKILDERYPHDKATGYKAGDLRGAVSIKIPL